MSDTPLAEPSDLAPSAVQEFTLCRLELTTTSYLAVGSSSALPGVNRPIATTPLGDPWVPPSSVAGALRNHLAQMRLDPVVYMGGTSEDIDTGFTPSMIRVMHTRLICSAEPEEVRQTRIDSRSGAAAQGSLRVSQQIAPGSTISVDLLIDGHHPIDSELVDALRAFAPQLGSGTTNGLGVTVINSISYGTLDLTQPADLAHWLRSGGRELFDAVATTELTPETGDSFAPIRIDCEVVDPLLIAPEITGNTAVTGTVLAGSSIKGVLRHRAEFILRSLALEEGVPVESAELALRAVFGSTDRRGRIRIDDAPVTVSARESRPHVAIDRFTGGGITGRLFAEDVISAGAFTIVITPLDELQQWEVDLMEAVVADIDDGFVAFGARTARGFGTVRVVSGAAMPDLVTVVRALETYAAGEGDVDG